MGSEATPAQISNPIDAYSSPALLASSSHDATQETDFFRSCSLCLDGSVAMTERESRAIELYSLPSASSPTERPTELTPARRFPQSASILGTLWYPTATPTEAASFCFLASIRECPVKLLDASDGRLRASYKIVDHRERFIAPNSMAFNLLSSKLYCGFQDAIEIFDINYPGEGGRMLTTPSKKSRSGLKGIISSLSFCQDYSGVYAAGTFSASIALFSEDSGAEIIQSLGGVLGPVTQVKFNPTRPHLLYATSRQSNAILAWDLRGNTSAPLQTFSRPGLTNQRIFFDVDAYGNTMTTGDQTGSISCFALDGEMPEKSSANFKAHNDAVSATAIHPFEPMMVSTSGSRHFEGDFAEKSASASESESSTDSSPTRRYRKKLPISHDSTIKLWRFPTRQEESPEPGVYNDIGNATGNI